MQRVVSISLKVNGRTEVIKSLQDVAKLKAQLESLKPPAKSQFLEDVKETVRLQKEIDKLDAEFSKLNLTVNSTTQSLNNLTQTSTGIQKLEKDLDELVDQFERLNKVDREGDKGSGLLERISKESTNIRNARQSLNEALNGGGVDDGSALSVGDVAQFTGVAAAVGLVRNELKKAISVSSEFARQISFVGAVSGATDEQLAGLRQSALDLGGITEFTASQVANLQIEFSKLGFTAAEIGTILSPTINLATVAQESLGRTAEVVGVTIRAFRLDVEDTARVVDVLAKSFSSSALDLTKFDVGVGIVGAVASTTGRSLEEVTAQLGVLSNAGFEASIGATALRNIFLVLQAEGLELNDVLATIREAGADGLTIADELFGRRGAAQAVALANNTADFSRILGEITNSGGFADQAATKIRKDLLGSFEALTSALERARILFVDLFRDELATVISGIAALVRGLGDGIEAVVAFKDSLGVVGNVLTSIAGATLVFGGGLRTIAASGRVLTGILGAMGISVTGLGTAIAGIGFRGIITSIAVALPQLAALTVAVIGLSSEFNKFEENGKPFENFLITVPARLTTLKNSFIDMLPSIGGFREGIEKAASALSDFLGIDRELAALGQNSNNLQALGLQRADVVQLLRLDQIEDEEQRVKALINLRDELTSVSTGRLGASSSRSLADEENFEAIRRVINNMFDLKDAVEEVEQTTTGGTVIDGLGKSSEDAAKKVGKVNNEFEAMKALQSSLQRQLQNLIFLGKDYADVNDDLAKSTFAISAATREYQEALLLINSAFELNNGNGSLEDLNRDLAALQKLQDSGLVGDTAKIGERIGELKLEIQLAQELQKLRNESPIEEASRQTAQQSNDVNFGLNTDIESILNSAKTAEQKTEEIAALREAAAIELAELEVDLVQNIISIIEGEGGIVSQELRDRATAASAAVTKIKEDALKQQVKDNEDAAKEIEKTAKEAQKAEEKRIKERNKALKQALNLTVDIFGALNDILDNQSDRQIAAIERKYDREVELAGNNAAAIQAIEERKDAALEKIQREQFERNKRLQLAQTTIDGAAALIKISAQGGIFAAPLLILQGILTAAQLVAIAGTTFAEGGFTGLGKGKKDKTGHVPVGVVHANEYVVPKKVLDTKEGRAHVDALEKMRRSKGYRAPTDFNYMVGGFTQNVPNANSVSNIVVIDREVNISEESADRMADIIARRNEKATERAIESASKKDRAAAIRSNRVNTRR